MIKKIALFLLVTLTLVIVLTPTLKIFGASSVTVNCNSVIREVTHCASGSLYGITETKPADINNLVAPLNPCMFTNPARAGAGYQQPYGAAIPTARRLDGKAGKVTIRLADIFPGWPYSFTNMSDWLNKVTSVINDKKSSGLGNFYGYEIWNEPNGTWKSANGSFNDMWLKTYNLIRSLDSGTPIIGPSITHYDKNYLRDFLSFCKTNNCLPDIVCWHELSSHDSSTNTDTIASHMKDYRSLESSLGISQKKISINEYCDVDHYKEGAPGPSASMIAKFERYKVDSACITWWFVAYPGRLGSLLATDTQKGAGWWFYKWYGEMSGNMVSVTPPDESSAMVDGFACVDSNARYISLLFGGNNDGTVNVTFNSIPSFIGSNANVKVEKVSWSSKDTVVSGTNIVSNSIYSVANNSITVSVKGCNNNDGYRIYITPGTDSGTTTTTRTTTIPSTTTQQTQVSPSPTTSNNNSTGNFAVSYGQNDWGNGATVSITIKNNGTTSLKNWILSWTFSGNQKITNLWNGSFTQSGASVTVKNAEYNGSIDPGSSINFGFNISYSGSNTKPTSCTLNGTACTIQ